MLICKKNGLKRKIRGPIFKKVYRGKQRNSEKWEKFCKKEYKIR